jgi:hypothetical protein
MAKQPDPEEVPEGAAVAPLIPETAGVSPLFLAVFHALVFLEGSSEEVVDPSAAEEAIQIMATYLQRLDTKEQAILKENLRRLTEYAQNKKWPKDQLEFIKDFLRHYGIGNWEP